MGGRRTEPMTRRLPNYDPAEHTPRPEDAFLTRREMLPRLGERVDDLCVIRSMWTDVPAHEPASRFMHTGSLQLPKPSLGAWVVYGLGSENQNMPGLISLGGKPEYRQAGFLPSLYQGSNVNYTPKMPLNE